MGVFCPESIPYSMLPVIGSVLNFINYTLWPIVYGWLAVMVVGHTVESVYAYMLAR